MSYTHHTAVATCTPKHNITLIQFIELVFRHLEDHPEDLPDDFKDIDEVERAEVISCYAAEDGSGALEIGYDTEDGCCDEQVFDLCVRVCASIHNAPFLKVIWGSYNSKAGSSGCELYYRPDGSMVDLDAAVKHYLESANGKGHHS